MINLQSLGSLNDEELGVTHGYTPARMDYIKAASHWPVYACMCHAARGLDARYRWAACGEWIADITRISLRPFACTDMTQRHQIYGNW